MSPENKIFVKNLPQGCGGGDWISSWGAAMLLPSNPSEQIPSSPGLEGSTLRQQIRTSFGGSKLSLVISNEFGDRPLVIESASISRLKSPDSYEILPETARELTFLNNAAFSVEAGERIATDPLDFKVGPFEDLAITFKLSTAPAGEKTLTCHTASRCSTWITPGSHVFDNDFSGIQTTTSWYYICRLDVLSASGGRTLVCFGDSLTDGASVTTNGFSTYPQELARLVQKDENLKNLSVINMGIGGTALYYFGEDCGKKRFDRDVADTLGAKYAVMLYGVNDIGASKEDISERLIEEYKNIIAKCREKGIKIIGCTITPFKGNAYYSELHENIRKKVNEFVLSKDSGFDGFIDLASAMASKSDPETLEREYISVWNDYLHFNDGGYKHVAKTVYEYIKNFIAKEK